MFITDLNGFFTTKSSILSTLPIHAGQLIAEMIFEKKKEN